MYGKHTDKSFDEELQLLEKNVLQMGGIVEKQISDAIDALLSEDSSRGLAIIEKDKRINDLQDEVDRHTSRLLSLRQPVGVDLRYIVSASKIASDLERIADYAANIAKHIHEWHILPVENAIESIVIMIRLAQGMLRDVLAAYPASDTERVIEIWHRDDQIDETYPKLLADLTDCMKKGPENIDSCTSLIFVARSIERIGDHITNIAEQIHYTATGRIYRGTDKAWAEKR